jgi:predicted PurR-regulated permease PerM
MRDLLDHPWMKVLLIATAIAMVSFALRETATITLPIVDALREVLVPLAIGFTIAYVLTPVVDWLCRRGLSRMVAAVTLYAGFAIVLAVALVFLVPAMVSQGKDLVQRTFVGEPWNDANANGRWDAGEDFTDTNRNGSWDSGFITRSGAWLQERQRDLRRTVQGPVDRRDLVFLARYAAATAADRAIIDGLLAGKPGATPPTLAIEAPAGWDPRWPGAAPTRIDAWLAVPAHAAQRPALLAAGARLAAIHASQLAALREARAANEPGPEGASLRAAWDARPGADVVQAGEAASLALEDDERQGIAAAAELLVELRGAEAGAAKPLVKMVDNLEGVARSWVDSLPGRIGGWAGGAFGSVGAVVSFALSVLLVPIYAFFLTLAMPRVREGVKTYLPSSHKARIVRIVRDIELVVSAFFRGRLLISLICAGVGVAGFYACALVGVSVPYAFLFGTAIGFATIIPLAGLAFLAPALAMTMMEPNAGVLHASLVIGVYVLVQTVEAILIPLIMGREVELHPVTLIVALLLCGKLLGVLGLILAVPIFATARILAREYLWPWLRQWAEGIPQPPDDPPAALPVEPIAGSGERG